MNFKLLIPYLCLSLLAACLPRAADPNTKDFLLEESEVPSDLSLPTIDWEFSGIKHSDKTRLIEQHNIGSGQRFVIYGYRTSIARDTSEAEFEIYYKGRSGTNDEWILRWNVDGNDGKKEFIYVPGTEQNLVDGKKFKVTVK